VSEPLPAPAPAPSPVGPETSLGARLPWNGDMLDVLSVLCLDAGIVGVASTCGSYVPEEYARLVSALARPMLLVPAILFLARRNWRMSGADMGLVKPARGAWRYFVRFALCVGGAYVLLGVIGIPTLRALHQHGTIDMERTMISLAAGSRRFLGGPFGAFSFAVLGLLSAPLCEELVYRGIVYPAMRSRMRLVLAVPVSAVIFALMHLVWHWRVFVPVTQLLGGLVFAWAYERTRSLVFPMILHAIGNAAILVWHLVLLYDLDLIIVLFTS
jgi:membrane protease YdiL (CAAX protease family)